MAPTYLKIMGIFQRRLYGHKLAASLELSQIKLNNKRDVQKNKVDKLRVNCRHR